MIIQLPCGRIIECSIELYLELSDLEVHELNGLGASYTREGGDPFYNLYNAKTPKIQSDEEYEPKLYEINKDEKLEDPDFLLDDI
jgi:hypothetical protein